MFMYLLDILGCNNLIEKVYIYYPHRSEGRPRTTSAPKIRKMKEKNFVCATVGLGLP